MIRFRYREGSILDYQALRRGVLVDLILISAHYYNNRMISNGCNRIYRDPNGVRFEFVYLP
jgi:hypothetical protein